MTQSDAIQTVRRMAEVLKTRPLIRMPDRAENANALIAAADALELVLPREPVAAIVPKANGNGPVVTWDDVDHLRAEARKARGMPGLHFRTNFFSSLADRLESILPSRGM